MSTSSLRFHRRRLLEPSAGIQTKYDPPLISKLPPVT